ncbi:MAG: hypothetical protein LUI09_06370, partial [Prevotellaceae bacterium]|nr:hypothetical protein [Prevotellaceae bacterium]
MMKRLSMFVALACLGLAVPMCVQADDQYVTYDGTTYKVVGDNLVTNPTFETTADQNDANAYTVEGWIAGDGTTITSTYFTVSEEEDATTGGKTLKFLGSDGSSSAQSLGTLWQVDPSKTYYLSIWTKNGNDSGSGTETILINDNNSTNDGSGNSGNEQHIMHITNTSSTFVQTVLVITPSDYAVDDYADVTYNYLGLRLARVGGESQDFEISNVELYEVEEVSADPENPLDITSSVLVNPDGSSANASDGWTTKQDFSYGPSTTYTNGDANLTSSFFEVYDATQLGDKTMSQTITLPAGEYRLTADAIAVLQSSHLTPVTGVSLYAGEAESTSISTYDGVPETFSVDFAVEPEDQATTAQVEVGVKVASTNANWVAVDNFKLYYLGSELSYEVFELTALVTEASELVDAIGVTDADLSAAISAAQEALGDDQSDAETLADALSTLQDALQAYKIANASEDYPVDMTESLGYWTGGSNYGSVAQLEENFDAAMETGTKLSQTISDLPAGVYEVKLYCVANYANDVEADGTPNSPTGASEGDNVVTVKANDATTAVTLSLKSASNASKPEYAVSSLDDMDIITVSNAIVEEDGTLSLSISVDVANAVNWILVGNYSLTYLGAAEEEEEEPADFTYLNNALEDAQTLELTSETAYTDGVTVSEDADATQSDVDAATEALAKLIQQNGTASEETVEI